MRRIGNIALILAFVVPLAGLGQSVVVATASQSGEIAFQPVEEFQVNQSKKIRILPDQPGAVDENILKRLPKLELPQVTGVIRNDGKGRLISLEPPAGKMRGIVLPENFTLKAPSPASDIPGRLDLSLIRSKKQKQVEPLPPEQFFAVMTGASPERAALEFAQKDWVFVSLDEQLRVMQGFVNAFRDSPEAGEFRSILERKISTGLTSFEDGGPFQDLITLRKFSELGRRAYPQDASLQRLHERLVNRIEFVDARLKLLRSLALAAEWDVFLDQYAEFEHYQWSFPDVIALRQDALEETSRAHTRRARAFALRDDHEIALREAEAAQRRDPLNKETANLVDAEKLLSSQAEARRGVATRKVLQKDSAEDRRFQRALFNAGNAIKDKDYAKAQEALTEAERENPDAPEILLARAQLLYTGDRLSEVLPLLDRYDRLVVDSTERQKGETLRNQVLYDLDKKRGASRKQIDDLLKAGEYSQLDELMKTALKSDADSLDYLYQGGITAAVLRDSARARQLLSAYLDRSNSLEGDLKKRDYAWRVRNAITDFKPSANGSANWMTGRKLADGIYYDPESLAFQIPLDSVTGNKVKMTFSWDQGRLDSIHTTFEDDKGARAYHQMSESDVADSTEDGNFFFQYSSAGQMLAARTNALSKPGPVKDVRVRVSREKKPAHLLDGDGQPILVLRDSPYVDLKVMSILEGPVGTTVAGNSFFNPFLWDGLHYFTVQYDSAGRADTALEWNSDNVLRFSWDGDHLTEIRGYKGGSGTPYYRRTIAYMGGQVVSEDYTVNGKAGKIRYLYMGKGLQQVKVESNGKEWLVKPRS